MDKRRVNVRAIIWHEGKLLGVKHKRSDGSEAPYWAVPGGGLDPNELLADGVKREVLEETNITAEVGKLLFIQQFNSNRDSYNEELEFFYHVTNGSDFTSIDLSKATHGLEEISRIEFIDPSQEHIMPSFLGKIAIGDYIDQDLPIYHHNELV